MTRTVRTRARQSSSHRPTSTTRPRTTTTTKHKNNYSKRTTKSRDQLPAHRGIVINRGGPASGRPPIHHVCSAPRSLGLLTVGGWPSC